MVLVTSGFMLSGCATIFRGRSDTVDFGTAPGGSHVTIYGPDNSILFDGPADESIELRRTTGFLERARYRALIEHPDYVSRDILLDTRRSMGGTLLGIAPFVAFVISAAIAQAIYDAEASDGLFFEDNNGNGGNDIPVESDAEFVASLVASGFFLTTAVGYLVDTFTGARFRLQPAEPSIEMVRRTEPSLARTILRQGDDEL